MFKGLAGQIALVTGAGSGIGRATVRLLARAGALVHGQDIAEAKLDDTAALCRQDGSDVRTHVFDIADWAASASWVQGICRDRGQIDILINNAGIGIDRDLSAIEEADFDRMIAVHVGGSFATVRSAIARMKQQKSGRIVNISSRWSLAGHDRASDYIGAKSAILGLTKAWAKEFAPYGISVNAIAPGGVKTQMVLDTLGEDGIRAEEANTPLGRWAPPEEIAVSIAFLASEEAGFITGQVLSPNGGKTILGF